MQVFRISRQKFSDKLQASGASNRWNKSGQNVIYTGCSRSLSTLELVVHRASIIPTEVYKVMVVEISNKASIKEISISELPENWNTLEAYSRLQDIGSSWYESQETLALKVPSAVISKEFNYVINTEHPDFKNHIKLFSIENFLWDSRLL